MSTATIETPKKMGSALSAEQRRLYFSTLWPRACKAQGWNPRDEDRRRAVTHQLIGKFSTTGISQLQITVLFRGLELFADEENIAKIAALKAAQDAVEFPEIGEHVKICGMIEAFGCGDAYLDKVALPHLRREGKSEWRKLDTGTLWKVFYALIVRTRKKEKDAAIERARTGKPLTVKVGNELIPVRETIHDQPRKGPWHERPETAVHETYMKALRGAFVGRLEEITPEIELDLLNGIDVRMCECKTCERRRKGDPGNAAAEKRAIGKEEEGELEDFGEPF